MTSPRVTAERRAALKKHLRLCFGGGLTVSNKEALDLLADHDDDRKEIERLKVALTNAVEVQLKMARDPE